MVPEVGVGVAVVTVVPEGGQLCEICSSIWFYRGNLAGWGHSSVRRAEAGGSWALGQQPGASLGSSFWGELSCFGQNLTLPEPWVLRSQEGCWASLTVTSVLCLRNWRQLF